MLFWGRGQRFFARPGHAGGFALPLRDVKGETRSQDL
jgi:hypothetical protein